MSTTRPSTQIGVLCSPDSWYARDLQRACTHVPNAGNVSVQPISFSQLAVWWLARERSIATSRDYAPTFEQVPLSQFHSIVVRSMPYGSMEQTIFRMNALHVAEAAGTKIINPPRCLEIAIDKWLTLDVANRAGIETPRTVCCQTRDDAMQAWKLLGSDCVVKPIFGGEGRGIVRVTDPDMAWRVFSTLEQLQAVIYIQEFLENDGYDLRLLVIGEEIFCVRREANGDWRSNVSRGGTAVPHVPTFEQVSIAYKACKAINGWMIGVDILPTRDGRNVLLELNAVPGWKATAAALNVDIASVVLNRLIHHGGTQA